MSLVAPNLLLQVALYSLDSTTMGTVVDPIFTQILHQTLVRHTSTDFEVIEFPRDEATRPIRALVERPIEGMPNYRALPGSLSGLRDGSVRQLRFEDLGDPGWLEAEQAVDRIRDRFGVGSIGPATTVGPEGLRPRERGDGQWGPED